MRIAFFSDLHGNKISFDQLIKELDSLSVDQSFFLGDAVGYMPDGPSIVSALRNSNFQCLKGNHEAMLLGQLLLDNKKDEVYKLREILSLFSSDDLEWLSNLPDSLKITIDGINFFLCHGSPKELLSGYIYPDSKLEFLEELTEDVFVVGNTHRAFVQKLNSGKYILNTGSIGLARDGLGPSFIIFDTSNRAAEIIRFDQDLPAIKKKYESRVHKSVIECLTRKANE